MTNFGRIDLSWGRRVRRYELPLRLYLLLAPLFFYLAQIVSERFKAPPASHWFSFLITALAGFYLISAGAIVAKASPFNRLPSALIGSFALLLVACLLHLFIVGNTGASFFVQLIQYSFLFQTDGIFRIVFLSQIILLLDTLYHRFRAFH